MKKTYFTFGSDPLFPFSQKDYVEVEAESMNQACDLFNLIHPPRKPGTCTVNCAFIYSEEKFEKIRNLHYRGVEPIEVISVRRREGR